MSGIFFTDFSGLAKVRLIWEGQKWVVPVVDVADAIGYDRQALHQIINREPEMFEDYVNVTLTNSGHRGRPEVISVTQEGINLLLMSLTPSRIKDQAKRQRVIAFKHWAAKTLTAVQMGRFPEKPCPINLTELFDLPSRLRANAVHRLASDLGVNPSTIYVRLNEARKLAGKPVRTRRDRGKLDRPEEARRILAYKHAHPNVSGPQICAELKCSYSVGSINRILKVHRTQLQAF